MRCAYARAAGRPLAGPCRAGGSAGAPRVAGRAACESAVYQVACLPALGGCRQAAPSCLALRNGCCCEGRCCGCAARSLRSAWGWGKAVSKGWPWCPLLSLLHAVLDFAALLDLVSAAVLTRPCLLFISCGCFTSGSL